MMRYWVVSCAVLSGGISLFRTGDPERVVASVVIGTGIGVILYGTFVALTSAALWVNQFSTTRGVRMKQFIWAGIFVITLIVRAMQSNLMFALGWTTGSFIIGLVLSPIWWGVTKKNRKSPWQWFDWLNAGAYIMLILSVLSLIVKAYMSSKGIR
jgi:hypothetical protein